MSVDGDGGRAATAPPASEILEGLNDLLRLDHDAVASYEVAIERLEDREHALSIAGFKEDHLTHIRRLNDLIIRLGGTPANEPHATQPLTEALLAVAATAGDRGILHAWRANELRSMAIYDRYASRAVRWPADIKRVVDENALDEERHYDWIVQTLGGGELGVDLSDRLRERLNALHATRARLARRAREGRSDVRGRLADLLAGTGAYVQERIAASSESHPNGKSAAGAVRHFGRIPESAAESVRKGPPDGGSFAEHAEERIRSSFGIAVGSAFAGGFLIGRMLRWNRGA